MRNFPSPFVGFTPAVGTYIAAPEGLPQSARKADAAESRAAFWARDGMDVYAGIILGAGSTD
jgi:hypothetical protein